MADEGLPEPELRVGKLGRKVHVELAWLLPADSAVRIGDADRFRQRLPAELRTRGQYLWLNVKMHTNPDWVTA